MNDIKNYETFTKIELINKGWSSDKKYYIETVRGEKRLLRISDISEYEQKKREIDIMKRMSALGINMSQPIDFGTCCGEKNVYQLLTWCEGEEAKVLLPSLSETEQYLLGVKAGEILKEIHTIETYPPSSDWSELYGKKINTYIEDYRNCGKAFDGDELLISFLEQHFHLMDNRPMCLTHEDFQADNLVISPKKELYVIDFEQCGIVDPYYALMSAMISADVSPHFATGQIHKYFDGKPSINFWNLFSFYFVAENINGFVMTMSLGQEEVDFAHKMIENTLISFDNMNKHIPTWYFRNLSI